ncbi:glutaminyl-peptide cyclotransferase [Corynebacterium sp. H128]|uniref:glutaminyl-peptide cyclotransferase n=1 Tax=Corynebacterium sp. H128 TaxID=3133427 RepID=UPI0030B7C2A0
MRYTFGAKLLGFIGLSSLLLSCSSSPEVAMPEELRTEILATHPGSTAAFTQGLEVDRANPNQLLVGTGWHGESRIYRRTIDGGELASKDLKPSEFGEGITQSGDHIWQLTWQSGVAYKRDATSLEVIDQAPISGEGWGLCAMDDHLIMSNGSATLQVLDPDSFAVQGEIPTGIDKLNELECVDGQIYANRFLTSEIVRLDAAGKVTARIDASSLPNNAAQDPNNVLNGIAHIPGTDRFLVTGKRWPDLYEVRFVPAD